MYSNEILLANQQLSRLGLTAKYAGYHFAAQAIAHAFDDPDKLQLVTKLIYPDIAKANHTSVSSIDRNIRTIISVAWEKNRKLLVEMAKYELDKKPTGTEFIAILTMYLHEITSMHETA